MEFVISYDMRAPSFGAPARELYAAALDQCTWADELGFHAIGLGEHHAAEDGYLPSPVPMAGAIAARTRRVTIRPNVLLAPLYEPVKLAEGRCDPRGDVPQPVQIRVEEHQLDRRREGK